MNLKEANLMNANLEYANLRGSDDLIFREGVDWRAFIYSFKKVQVENSETELTIQRIENKGDGVFIVRVQVPPEADKTKIHQNFTQTYQETLQTLETEY
ncbi:MAG: pentapeptide repeat-containing protein [Planktothrix rubescens PR222]|nr:MULTISPECIES: pentapeptide repeat-containing protein [Planktothrix]